jgi:hypothetical protein
LYIYICVKHFGMANIKKLNIMIVYLYYCFIYSATKSLLYASYWIVTCGLSDCTLLSHIILKKAVIFSTTLSETFLILEKVSDILS